MKNNIITAENIPFVWDYLKNTNLPIVLYGMGNGADKIVDLCDYYSIKICDIFTSDDFFRNHSFRGFKIKKFSEISSFYQDCIILITFASFRDEVFSFIDEISKKYTVLAPEVPLFGTDIFTPDVLKQKADAINSVYGMLADEKSKFVFESVINYKLSGNINILRACETEREEIFENIIKLTDREDYIDLGAFRGDTIDEFLLHTNGFYNTITAFEPAVKNFERLKEKVENEGLKNITLLNAAAYSHSETMFLTAKSGRNPFLASVGFKVNAISVDSLNQPASFIKMDVEGAESAVLRGMSETIKKYAPTLLVSAYHKTNDFFELALQIKELNPSYKIYLRHQPYIPAWETNLIAVI